MGQIIRSDLARRDALEIWQYIALDNPRAADRLLDQIEHAVQLLSDNPGMGPARDDLVPGLRMYPVRNYLILYRRSAFGIDIARIVHGARDLRALFEE